jgi:hypothetical protein
MTKIEELIKRYENLSTGNDEADVFIKVKLKMIRGLFEDIKGSEEHIYMEEIISKFAEIMDCQQEIIMEGIMADAAAAGYGPPQHNWVDASGNTSRTNSVTSDITSRRLTADDIPWDPDCESFEREEPKDSVVPSYMPPEGGFQSDEQVKKAFINYLTYHVERKTKDGKDRPFSVHTIYDYSSRIKCLMEIVCEEWMASNKDGWIQLDEQTLRPGCPFLNAYHNISVLKRYVERKEQELIDISNGLREPMPEGKRTPLDNGRNLTNTKAALVRFEDFRNAVNNQLQ